jgi:sialate O-acetylesterase
MKRVIAFLLINWICLPQSGFAKIKLPVLVGNGMILQRDQCTAIWGWANSKEKITVTFQGNKYTTNTGITKEWKVWLPAMPAGGPFSITIEGQNKIVISNILFGDVWLCSGQSNMEYVLRRSQGIYQADIAQAGNSQIRQISIKPNWSYTPQCNASSEGWKLATPENVLNFTAVGYFFANAIYNKYHIPIGLISSSYGGTPVQSWISEDALIPFPNLLNQYNAYKDTAKVNAELRQNKEITTKWYQAVNRSDAGRDSVYGRSLWAADTVGLIQWHNIQVPGFWEEQNLKSIDGAVWYNKEVNLPVQFAGQNALLNLGYIFQEDSTYFNGYKVGSTSSQYLSRVYRIPGNLVKAGKNIITVRILNREGNGGFLKDKLYELRIGQTVIPLSGTWQYRIGASSKPLESAQQKQFSREPTVLFNSMISPLTNYGIKGVLWYQGENNTGDARQYASLFPALINNWRRKWKKKKLPFLYVQLANYQQVVDRPGESQWAELREAQSQTLKIANTAMAVIHDTGEWNDIHPANKKDVGSRLALAAQHVAYHEKGLIYSGPVYESAQIKHHKLIITFAHTGSGLIAKNGGLLKQFAIAGANRKFVWAQAAIQGSKVVVWADGVTAPVAVRYAWANNPEGANLYNAEGLPASSFRTDNWNNSNSK